MGEYNLCSECIFYDQHPLFMKYRKCSEDEIIDCYLSVNSQNLVLCTAAIRRGGNLYERLVTLRRLIE